LSPPPAGGVSRPAGARAARRVRSGVHRYSTVFPGGARPRSPCHLSGAVLSEEGRARGTPVAAWTPTAPRQHEEPRKLLVGSPKRPRERGRGGVSAPARRGPGLGHRAAPHGCGREASADRPAAPVT